MQKDGKVDSQFFAGADPAGLMIKNGMASVAVTAGFATDYGQTKCTVTVTLACDQSATCIAQAYKAALAAAHEMAVDGMAQLVQDGRSFSNGGQQ